jgi:hypothetical protein
VRPGSSRGWVGGGSRRPGGGGSAGLCRKPQLQLQTPPMGSIKQPAASGLLSLRTSPAQPSHKLHARAAGCSSSRPLWRHHTPYSPSGGGAIISNTASAPTDLGAARRGRQFHETVAPHACSRTRERLERARCADVAVAPPRGTNRAAPVKPQSSIIPAASGLFRVRSGPKDGALGCHERIWPVSAFQGARCARSRRQGD